MTVDLLIEGNAVRGSNGVERTKRTHDHGPRLLDAPADFVIDPSPMFRLIPLALLVVLLLALPAEAKPPVSAGAYKVLPGVKLTGEVRGQLERLARAFKKKTGQPLVVTSGTRSPMEQAAAMYHKLRRRRNLFRLYRRGNLLRPVVRAYRKARRARKNREATIRAMARVMRAQVRRGEHLSLHMRDGAVDIRSYDLGRRNKRLFRRLVRKEPNIVLVKEERYPPHFHLEVYAPASPRP